MNHEMQVCQYGVTHAECRCPYDANDPKVVYSLICPTPVACSPDDGLDVTAFMLNHPGTYHSGTYVHPVAE